MSEPFPQPVVVYSTPFCAPCERLKAYLRSRGVPFAVRDPLMDEAAAEFLEERRVRTMPALRVGDEVVAGFEPAVIDAFLGIVQKKP